MENQVSSSSSIALHHISRPQHKTGTSESLSESFPKKVGKNANPYKSLKISKSSGAKPKSEKKMKHYVRFSIRIWRNNLVQRLRQAFSES